MRHIRPDMLQRFLCLKVMALFVLSFTLAVPDSTRAQAAVEKFLLSHFASYKEEASRNPGGATAAVTVLTFSNVFNGNCNISVSWLRRGAEICRTQTNASSPLLQNGIINHCSRRANLVSGFPNCSEFCLGPNGEAVEPGEGLARISVAPECAENVGFDASVYYTLFESEDEREIILSTRSPQVYKLDGSMPPKVQ